MLQIKQKYGFGIWGKQKKNRRSFINYEQSTFRVMSTYFECVIH